MSDDAHTVVVIEDDAATLGFLADNLTADGYDVLAAESARDGLRLIETKYPDVALLDLGLPDLDGLVLLARLRAAVRVLTSSLEDAYLEAVGGR